MFGIPHDKWGETPMAVCQVARLGEVSLEEIAGLIRLAEAKQRATTARAELRCCATIRCSRRTWAPHLSSSAAGDVR